jgi:hypothetical protein
MAVARCCVSLVVRHRRMPPRGTPSSLARRWASATACATHVGGLRCHSRRRFCGNARPDPCRTGSSGRIDLRRIGSALDAPWAPGSAPVPNPRCCCHCDRRAVYVLDSSGRKAAERIFVSRPNATLLCCNGRSTATCERWPHDAHRREMRGIGAPRPMDHTVLVSAGPTLRVGDAGLPRAARAGRSVRQQHRSPVVVPRSVALRRVARRAGLFWPALRAAGARRSVRVGALSGAAGWRSVRTAAV